MAVIDEAAILSLQRLGDGGGANSYLHGEKISRANSCGMTCADWPPATFPLLLIFHQILGQRVSCAARQELRLTI